MPFFGLFYVIPINGLCVSVDGNWGHWMGWTQCSANCGGGTRTRVRRCNYPPPSHGGKLCPGSETKEEPCNEEPCPGKPQSLNFEITLTHWSNLKLT